MYIALTWCMRRVEPKMDTVCVARSFEMASTSRYARLTWGGRAER